MVAWQEGKVELLFGGEACWSELPQVYARYGTESGRALLSRIRSLEGAEAALLCDSGMQASALVFDVLMEPGSHAVMFRQVYNKTEKYLSWLAQRTGAEVTIVDDGDLDGLAAAIRPTTRMVFAETYSNPLMRALDLVRVPNIVAEARAVAPQIKLVVDSTIATPWGFAKPLLESGVDVVIASATKALGGQDRDLGGIIATNNIDLANSAMDLMAMRGGILDWRRAEAILGGLQAAESAHAKRCHSANIIAAFLDAHPKVEKVFHPSLPSHPDAAAIAASYVRHGSLLSFRLKAGDNKANDNDASDNKANGEDAARRFCDALATCKIVRYALSFDGLCSKVNHHKSVSEYFTPNEALQRSGLSELIRLAVGVEDPHDLCAALNWALHEGMLQSDEELGQWRADRKRALGL
jgi:methionine-gamma-lyase